MVVAPVTMGGFVWVKASSVSTPTLLAHPKFRIRRALLDSVHPPLACPRRGIWSSVSLFTGASFWSLASPTTVGKLGSHT